MTHRFWKSLLLGGALAAPPACWAQTAEPGVLAREPTTPPEMFDAAVTLLKLSRPEQARLYLADLLAAQPDDTTLLEIRTKYGTALLLRMSRMETLQPEGKEILDRVVAAAETQLQDPAFQAAMVQDLTGDLRQREAAINILSALGSNGVALVLGQIAKGVTPDEQDQLLQALVRIGPNAIAPAEAALLSPVDSVRPVAAELLGRLDARDSLPLLMSAAFDPDSPPALQSAARRAAARLEHGDPAQEAQVSDFRLMERLKAEALACFSGNFTRGVVDDGSV
jgi:HEAT repeat protein